MNPRGNPRKCPGCGRNPVLPVTTDERGPHCPACEHEFTEDEEEGEA